MEEDLDTSDANDAESSEENREDAVSVAVNHEDEVSAVRSPKRLLLSAIGQWTCNFCLQLHQGKFRR